MQSATGSPPTQKEEHSAIGGEKWEFDLNVAELKDRSSEYLVA